MRSFTIISVVSLLAAATAVQPPAGAAPREPEPIIAAYVFPQDKALQPGDIDAKSLTRINYAFANIDKGRIVTGFAHDAENYAYLNQIKAQNPSLVVLVSVGGWLWSKNFSDVCLTANSRRIFIDSVMEFLNRYHLDGLDIDWEYPGLVGDGNVFRPEDKENFTAVLKELRERFDAQTRTTHRHLYLTIAAGSSTEFLDHTEMDKVSRYVDTVNLMAYDYYEPDNDKITGHHAPLFTNPADPKKVSADQSVLEFERAGVPADKLVLGMPFYGHTWGHVPPANHGLYQRGDQIPNAYSSYSNIQSIMARQPSGKTVRYWDDVASVPYIYDAETQTFISYEDPQSIKLKCRYVLDHHLAGVMFWDYESDPTGTLLKAVDESLQTPKMKGRRP